MKPAWDKLMKEYKGHASILVGDVDCTAGGKDLCEKMGVQGFPSIKHGDPNNLEDYEGGRDEKALSAFAKENLGPTCGPANLDLCDADKKAQINKFMAMSDAELTAAVQAKDDEMKEAETTLEKLLKSLQSQYEEATKNKDATKAEIKASGLGLMKAVSAHKKSAKSEL